MWWLGLVVSILGLVSRPAGAEQWKFGQWVGIQQLGGIPVIQTRIDVYPECPPDDCAAYWQYEVLFVDGRVFGVNAGLLPANPAGITQGVQIYEAEFEGPNRGRRRGGLEPGMRVVMIPEIDTEGRLGIVVQWGNRTLARSSFLPASDAVLVRLTLFWRNREAGEFPVPFVGTAVLGDVLDGRRWPATLRSRNTRAPHGVPVTAFLGSRRLVWFSDDHRCDALDDPPAPGQDIFDNEIACCTLEQALLDAPACPGGIPCCLDPIPYEPLETSDTVQEPAG